MMERILVPLDGSARSEVVLPYVAALAVGDAARVTLVQVVEPSGPVSAHNSAARYLDAVAARLEDQDLHVKTAVVHGPAAQSLMNVAERYGFHLVAAASRQTDDSDVWGRHSVAEVIIRGGQVPVLVVRPDAPAPDFRARFQHIIAPLDGSETAEASLPVAATLAQRTGAELDLVQAVPTPAQALSTLIQNAQDNDGQFAVSDTMRVEARRYLSGVASTLPQDIHASVVVAEEEPTEAIIDYAEQQPDALVVLCSAGETGVSSSWQVGSVTEHVLTFCPVPLLVVPPDFRGG